MAIFCERPGRAFSGEMRPPPPPPESMSKNPMESVSLLRILVRAEAKVFATRGVLLMLCTDLPLEGRNAEQEGEVARRLAMQRDERLKRTID